MDLPQLVQVLQACMSHDQSQRQQAEQHLKQVQPLRETGFHRRRRRLLLLV